MSDSAWSTDLGGFDDYIGTVQDAWFAIKPEYNAEVLLLNLSVRSDDLEDLRTESFSTGKGWITDDGGKSAVHVSGNTNKRFHAKSAYGLLIDRAVKEFQLAEVLRKRGTPNEAGVWVGLTFHFRREEFNYGGEIGTRSRVMPVEFIGTQEVTKQSTFGDDLI